MKNLGLILSFLLLSLSVFCQEVPKKSNLIKFESDSIKNFELFKKCVMILKKDGYTFDKLDKDFYMCSTTPIEPKRMNLEYRLDISVIENKVEIRSFVKLLDNYSGYSGGLGHKTENTWERGANRGLSTSIWRYGWNQQIEFINKLKENTNGTLSYIKEETK